SVRKFLIRSATVRVSGFSSGFAPGSDGDGGSTTPAISRCHALRASFSLPSPLTFRLTFLPSTVTYQAFLLALNQGLLGRAIACTRLLRWQGLVPVWCPDVGTFAFSRRKGSAPAGSALEWHSRGQGFDPPLLHTQGPP